MLERNLILTNLKRHPVFLADSVKKDLRDIHNYIVVNFYSQQSADGKVDLILSALETLEMFPEVCPLVSSRGYGDFITLRITKYLWLVS